MRMGACTDIGRIRKINEDSYFSYRNENLVGGMVADGMGGYNAGEIASKMTTMIVKDCIIRKFDPNMSYVELGELIRRAFIEANSEIFEYARHHEEAKGMGTTASMGFIYKEKLVAVHVGDSRIYAVSENGIRQVTTDHSYVQELLSRGQITGDAARNHPQKNLITRAIGTDSSIKVDVNITDYGGETVFICSDGLSNLVSDEQIRNVLNEHEDLQAGVEALVALANKKGGNDNITCLAFNID
ncbi:MAG: Stp1/IreP family PP2C-type Ser/Thr phosphatase [Clostridiales bacterium]|nr:Stp1/IreP family PP2C-type Ser/Thr phosphatase [Clostridiales bacterium]